MRRIKTLLVPVILIVLVVTLTGCDMPEPSATPPPPPQKVWILEPANGETLPLSATTIKLQGASYSGIADFEVSVNGALLGQFAPTSSSSGGPNYGTMFFVEVPWTPPAAGDYKIQARAKNAQGQFSPSVSIDVTVGETLAAEPGPVPIQTVPGLKPTKQQWQALSSKNANCRAGAGTNFNETGFVPEGVMAEVVGRNEQGNWLEVLNPNGKGTCWASIIAFEVNFAVEELPVHESDAQPLPGKTEEPSDGKKATGCLITNSLTGASECISPCPAGATGPACTP
jgi:hypothetical protein